MNWVIDEILELDNAFYTSVGKLNENQKRRFLRDFVRHFALDFEKGQRDRPNQEEEEDEPLEPQEEELRRFQRPLGSP